MNRSGVPLGDPQRIFSTRPLEDRVAFRPEDIPGQGQDLRVVIDHEDAKVACLGSGHKIAGQGPASCREGAANGGPFSRSSRIRSLRHLRSPSFQDWNPRRRIVTETGWPTAFGPIPSQQAPIGISNARDYLTRVTAGAQTQQVVLCIHNMFDDQFGVDTSSPLNYHFGLIDYPGASKGILF